MEQFYQVPHESWEMLTKYNKEYDKNPLMVKSVRYYDRYLLQKAMSVFEWTIPDNWDLNFFLFNLYTRGYVCISDFPKYGVIPQFATISGFNIYYNPARCIISNPYLKIPKNLKEIDLGKNGELLVLTPDYCGILDLINTFAELMANALCGVNTNLYNSRMAYMFWAKNKAQAESYKKMYDEIGTGVPAVFIDAKLMQEDVNGNLIPPFAPFNAELGKNYVATNILEDMHRIEQMFNQIIGLPNMNTEKKERMNNAEVNKTDIESVAYVTLWHDMLDKTLSKVKNLYPDLNVSFDYRFPITAYESMTEMEAGILSAEGTVRDVG